MRRRRYAAALAAALAALAAYAVLVEPNAIELTVTEVRGTGTEARIVFMADPQRRDADPAFVRRAVGMAMDAGPDVVLLGGDYIDRSAAELPSVDAFRDLEAPLGVYAVLGNHDYAVLGFLRSPPDEGLAAEVSRYLEEGGITVLRNGTARAGPLHIAGMDSYWAGARDDSLARGLDPGAFRVVLAHNQAGLPVSGEDADLYLFGHTHCGQIRLPLVGSVPKVLGFVGEYDYRHYEVRGADVYTTCGLAPYPRFLSPPEVTVIDLLP